MQHYRNYTCHINGTNKTRISNTLEFFPACCDLPETSAADRMNLLLNEINETIKAPQPGGPSLPPGTPGTEIDLCLQKIGKILTTGVIGPRVGKPKSKTKTNQLPPPQVETVQPPRVKNAPTPRVGRRTRSNTIYGMGTIVCNQKPNGIYREGEVTAYDSINGLYRIKYENGATDEYDSTEMKRHHKHYQVYSSEKKYNNKALFAGRYREESIYNPH